MIEIINVFDDKLESWILEYPEYQAVPGFEDLVTQVNVLNTVIKSSSILSA